MGDFNKIRGQQAPASTCGACPGQREEQVPNRTSWWVVALGLKRRWVWPRNWSRATLYRGTDLTMKVCLVSCFHFPLVSATSGWGSGSSATAEPIGSLLYAQYLLKSHVSLTGTHVDPVVGIVPVFQRRNMRLRLVSAPKGTWLLAAELGFQVCTRAPLAAPPSPPGLGAGALGTSLPNSPEAGRLAFSSNWSGGSHFYLTYLLVWLKLVSLKTFHQLHFF